MWYHKFKYKGNLIEFKNGTWDGVETIIVNGVTVSSKYSILGTSHKFKVGNEKCTLIVKLNLMSMMEVYLSFYAGKELIFKDFLVKPTFTIPGFSLKLYSYKQQGEKHLKLYDIDEAILDFQAALNEHPDDADSHFYLACCYSLKEMVDEGIYHLKRFSELEQNSLERIEEEDRLAFLRVQPAFEAIEQMHG